MTLCENYDHEVLSSLVVLTGVISRRILVSFDNVATIYRIYHCGYKPSAMVWHTKPHATVYTYIWNTGSEFTYFFAPVSFHILPFELWIRHVAIDLFYSFISDLHSISKKICMNVSGLATDPPRGVVNIYIYAYKYMINKICVR